MKKLLIGLLVMGSVSSFANTSASNRSGLKHQVYSSIGVDYTRTVNQYAYNYFIDSNKLIGVKYGASKPRDRIGNTFGRGQESLSVIGKQFFGNSFYAQVDITYLNLTFSEHRISFNDEDDIKGSASLLAAGIRIGNQWQWGNFTIGCDWLGLGFAHTLNKTDYVKTGNRIATGLNFYIGSSF